MEKSHIKTFMLYIADKMPEHATDESLMYSIMQSTFADITETSDALEALIGEGLLVRKDRHCTLSDVAKDVIDVLTDGMMPSEKEGVEEAMQSYLRQKKEKYVLRCSVTNIGEAYVLRVGRYNGDEVVVESTMRFDNEKDATKAKIRFEREGERILRHIEGFLTGDASFLD